MTETTTALGLAVVAAACFAAAATVQHDAVRSTFAGATETGISAGHLRSVVRDPGWLAGVTLGIAGVGLHVGALSLAPLSVVQPVGVLAVPLAVVLVCVRSGRPPSRGVLPGVALTVVGVTVFVLLSAGAGRRSPPASGITMVVVMAVVAAAVTVLAGLSLTRRGWVRSVGCATAGAVAFGLVSALLRTLLTEVGSGRLGPFDPVVVGMVAGMGVAVLAGGWLVQQSLASGPPEVSLSCLTVVDPIVAVALGAVLGESLSGTSAWAWVGAVAAAAGVVFLARHHPASMATPARRTAIGRVPTGPDLLEVGAPDGRRRILVGVDTFGPDINGAARFADRLTMGLAGRGHDVHVVAPSDTGPAGTEHVGRVTVHRVRSHRLPGRPLRVCLPGTAARAADALVDEFDPEVVHVQSHFAVGRGVLRAARRIGRPVVATNHVMPENLVGHLPLPSKVRRVGSTWFWADLRRVFADAAVVTAPTPRAVDLLVAAGIPDAIPVSCGIDLAAYYDGGDGGVGSAAVPTVLFVGRLDEEKHVDELIRAFAALPGGLPAELEIIGEGARRRDWTALAGDLGVGERVQFRGFVPRPDLVESYARAAVFVMPSTAELQSIATLEAMAASTPVIAADAMALPHLVRPGSTGRLYASGDISALTADLAALLADPAERHRLGQGGRRLVADHAETTTLDTFEDLYARALDPAGGELVPAA